MRRRDERGSAIVEFVWLALLLLVPLVYVVLAVFDAQRTTYAVSAAARSAGRAFVTAPSQGEAYARADAAARLALRDQGVTGGMRLTISCDPRPSQCLTPGSVVRADVRSSVDLPLMPRVLGGNTPRIRVDASHRAPYGAFREARP